MKNKNLLISLALIALFLVKCQTNSEKKSVNIKDTLLVFYDDNTAMAGFKNVNGDTIIRPAYEYAGDFKNGLAVVYKDRKYGFIDKKGKIVVRLKFKEANPFRGGLAAVQLDSGWSLIDTSGNIVKKLPFDEISTSLDDSLYSSKLNGLYGVIDLKGTTIIKPKYPSSMEFHEGIARFSDHNTFGFFNVRKIMMLPGRYTSVGDFQEGLASVLINGKIGFIDKSGNSVIPPQYELSDIDLQFHFMPQFNEGLARVRQKGKTGFIDKKGTVVVPIIYDDCDLYFDKNGFSVVQIGKKYGIVSKTGKVTVPPTYDYISKVYSSDKLYTAQLQEKYGFINETGKVVIPLKYEGTYGFEEGLAFVKKGNKYALINEDGKELTPFQFDDLYGGFEQGVAEVKKGNKYIFINRKGKILISDEYDKVSNFHKGTALVEKDGIEFYINKKGEILKQIGIVSKVKDTEKEPNNVKQAEEVKKTGNVSSPSKELTNEYEVFSPILKTKMYINIGDKLIIKGSGEIVLGMFAGSGGVNGIDGYTEYCLEPDFRHGSLLYKIGNGNWALVGNRVSVVAKSPGMLQFMVNDNDPSNNSGSFHVEVHCLKAN